MQQPVIKFGATNSTKLHEIIGYADYRLFPTTPAHSYINFVEGYAVLASQVAKNADYLHCYIPLLPTNPD